MRTEGRVLRRLTHVNIVQCFGSIESDALVALVLSCEPGFSLAEVVTTHGALAEPQAAVVTLQRAAGNARMGGGGGGGSGGSSPGGPGAGMV